jgi:hypothetical protein
MLNLRIILSVLFGVMTVIFALMAVISIFRFSQGFVVTQKSIKVSSLYFEICALGTTLSGIAYAPSKLSAWISGLIILSAATGIYLLTGLLYISMWEHKRK